MEVGKMDYKTHEKRHGELLQLISDIWDGHKEYEDHRKELHELYLIGQSLRFNKDENERCIGKKTKALVKEIDEHVILSRYYKEDSRTIQKSLKRLRGISTAMVNAIVRLQGGEVSGF
jgi:hypothetical protein